MYSSLRLCSAKIPSNSGERTNGVNEATTNLFLLKVYTQKKTLIPADTIYVRSRLRNVLQWHSRVIHDVASR